MKIALVISSLGAGGAERVIITLANHWAARGRAVTLLTFAPPGSRPYYAIDPRVALRELDAVPSEQLLRSLLQSLRRFFVLRRAIRAIGPDVVISFLAKINIITVLATRGLGIRVIVSERNNPLRQVVSPVWRWLRDHLYGVADRLVTPSRGVLASLPAAVQARGRVIPNPVDLPKPVARRSDGRTLVAVGRLDEQKGFDLLLQAFANVAGRHPEWRLVIWGEGEERAPLGALRDRLGLADRVQMPGVTERPGQWVDDAALFVLSSRYESFGNVVTEAMAAGLPVLVTDCPWGPGEIVRHGVDGWLVPPEDVAALAEGLDLLMGDDALRARLAATARRNVRRFGRARVMALWDELVDELRPGHAGQATAGDRHPRSPTARRSGASHAAPAERLRRRATARHRRDPDAAFARHHDRRP
jgi:glycosyltransferase involved in cell wall biosynthesis